MTAEENKVFAAARVNISIVDAAIQIGLLALLGYWSLKVIGPFLTVTLWSAILAVALYPLFSWLARPLRSPRLAAILITLLCLIMVIGPVTWLSFSLIEGIEFVVKGLDSHILSVPLPPESVKSWPVVGVRVYQLWTLAATDVRATLVEVVPKLEPFAGQLLGVGKSVVFGLLEFVAAIVIAGFLLVPGPQMVNSLKAFLRRILRDRSEEMVQLAGSTIRNVSRGVVGISLVQSLLGGMGFLFAGIPAAGFLSFVALVLGILQIGPAILFLPIVAWSWTEMETKSALMFTAYMIPVGLVDNILRPLVMARGLTTPMPVILVGVIGGTMAFGITGLFLGPIVLSVAWALVVAWVQDVDASADSI